MFREQLLKVPVMELKLNAMSIEGFANQYGLGKTKSLEEIKSGRLATYRVGRRRFVSAHAAEQWQRNLELLEAESKLIKVVT
jgi:hypothetical protein